MESIIKECLNNLCHERENKSSNPWACANPFCTKRFEPKWTLEESSSKYIPPLKVDIKSLPTKIVLTKNNEEDSIVKFAKWVNPHWRNSIHCYDCSRCGKEAQHGEFRGVLEHYKFCPHCGLPMEKKTEEKK